MHNVGQNPKDFISIYNKMSNNSFSQYSKSSKQLGDEFPSNWKTYISPEFNYYQGSASPSFESKSIESQRCINEYEKYNHILVGLRFDQDPLFNTIVARCI